MTPAQTNAALNYLNSLTGTVARRADQTVNFGRVDWQRGSGSRVVLEYNRARWSSPAGARSKPWWTAVWPASGSSYGKVDAGVARWIQFVNSRLSNELRVQYGRQLQYESPQTPLAQEPNMAGRMPPEVSIGPRGWSSERRRRWARRPSRRASLRTGGPGGLGARAALPAVWRRLQRPRRLHRLTDQRGGTFSYDSSTTTVTGSQVTPVVLGGLANWITDYTFNVNAYPTAAVRMARRAPPLHYFCFRSYSQSFGQQSLTFHSQEWAGFFQDDWRATQRLTIH